MNKILIYNYIKMKKTTITKATSLDLRKLYNDSSFTLLGICDELKEYEAIDNYLFETCWLKRPDEVEFYKCSWKAVNEEFWLEWDNRFKDDLNFVFMPLRNFENWEIWRLAMIKLSIWARWFDDVINNSLPEDEADED